MRISDWSSDVCSSDLLPAGAEALQDIGGARTGWDQLGLGRGFEIGTAEPRGSLEAAILVQDDAGRDQRRPGQMIGEPVGTASIFAKHQHSRWRSEEHTSELQSLMRISYAVFCLKKKNNNNTCNTDKHNNISINTYDT